MWLLPCPTDDTHRRRYGFNPCCLVSHTVRDPSPFQVIAGVAGGDGLAGVARKLAHGGPTKHVCQRPAALPLDKRRGTRTRAQFSAACVRRGRFQLPVVLGRCYITGRWCSGYCRSRFDCRCQISQHRMCKESAVAESVRRCQGDWRCRI